MFFFFQAEDGIRDGHVTGVQTCALPISGTAKSYLVATESMKVYIKALDKEIDFEAWESIHTEISQKYDDAAVAWLAKQAGLEILHCFTDARNYYKNYVFKSILD